MSRMLECHSRHTIDESAQQHFCAHPKVSAPGQLVSAEICRICQYRLKPPPEQFRPFPPRRTNGPDETCFYRGDRIGVKNCQSCRGTVKLKTFECRHPLHGEVTLHTCRTCSDFEPLLGRGDVRDWAVGMTTAPRKDPTIERCLNSVAAAGWDEVHVFAEPHSPMPDFSGVRVTQRSITLGVVNNWFLGLSELVQHRPDADAYMMLQDDIVLARNVRPFLESQLWPNPQIGLVSAYCSKPFQNNVNGFHAAKAMRSVIGALCFIIPAAMARWILTTGMALLLRRMMFKRETHRLDVLIDRILRSAKAPIYFHSPSLVGHIGCHSTLWPGVLENEQRRTGGFVGEEADARHLVAHQDEGGL